MKTASFVCVKVASVCELSVDNENIAQIIVYIESIRF